MKYLRMAGGTVAATTFVAVIIFFFYGCYWVAKNVSYAIFYEDMVQTTITEMVRPEALNSYVPEPADAADREKVLK